MIGETMRGTVVIWCLENTCDCHYSVKTEGDRDG